MKTSICNKSYFLLLRASGLDCRRQARTGKSFKRFLSVACFAAVFTACSLHARVVINEYSVSNLSTIPDNYSKYEDWIELYNSGTADMEMGGYFLSDNPDDNQKWVFPYDTYLAGGGYLVIWASGRDEAASGNFHTNFRLTQTGQNPEWIVLSNPSGTIVEEFALEITQDGHSRGRMADGGTIWGIFINPL